MPSAASVKVEKPPTTNISAINAVAANNKDAVAQAENVDNSSPVRQVALIIEHKIRNLEKRKVSKSKLQHNTTTTTKKKNSTTPSNQTKSKFIRFSVFRIKSHQVKNEMERNGLRIEFDCRLCVPCVRMHVFRFFFFFVILLVVCVAHTTI